jgi:hypothetical protein
MARRRRLLRILHAALLLVVAAVALRPAAAAQYPVELIPIIGVRGGADLEADVPAVPPATANPSLSIGLAVDWFVRPDAWFEVFVDHQTLRFTSDPSSFGTSAFDLAVDYLQFGGGYGPQDGPVRPYVTAGVGLTRYGASPADVGSTIGASGSIGGGIKVPIDKRVAFRFELRGYATLTDAAVSVACGPGCFVQFSANGWYQLAATVGLAIRL